MKPILISGGGIAGLALAVALTRENVPVQIFEKVSVLKGLGAGLILSPNAWKAIDVLGLTDLLRPVSHELTSFSLRTHSGKVLNTQSGNQAEIISKGERSWSVHRGDLHRLLIAALPDGVLHTGSASSTIRQTPDSVILTLADGREIEGSGLIAADGIHSPIRRQLQPDRSSRYAGYTCWRGVARMALPHSDASETWGPAGRFGIVPLSEDRVYWFATKNAPRKDPNMAQWSAADLLRNFSGYHEPIQQILTQTREEEILWNDIDDLPPADHLVENRVLLIGDAGHATTPNMGQGAAMALEDAAWLAIHFNPDQIPETFSRFEQARLDRVNWVVNRSWQFGKIGQLENKWACGLRNMMMRSITKSASEKTLHTLYEISF